MLDTKSTSDGGKLAVKFSGRVEECLAPKRTGTKEKPGFDDEQRSDPVMSCRCSCPGRVVLET